MDISIIGAAPTASAQPRSSQGPAAGTDNFALHLQQAQATAGDDASGVASPAAETPARTTEQVADTGEAQARVQTARPEYNTAPVAADVQLLQTQASTTALPDSSAAAAPAQPLDTLDEIRRRLALIEQAGQLPGAEAAAAMPPLQAAAPAQAPENSPLAAAISSLPAARTPQIPAVAAASPRDTLLQPTTQKATTAGAELSLAAQEQAAPDLAVATAARSQADAGALAGAGSDIAPEPAVTFALQEATPGPATTGSGVSPSGVSPSAMLPSGSQPGGMLPGIANLSGMAGSATPSAILAAPLASREWQQDLGQQLIGLHQRGEQQIELHLHPSELGPLSVSLKLGELGAQAQFLSAHPQVRAAVEQAIPQLRDALAAQGITLGETSVGAQHQPQGEQQAGNGAGNRQGSASASVQNDGDQPSASLPQRTLRGQVDLYA